MAEPDANTSAAGAGSDEASLVDLIARCALSDQQALARLYQVTAAQLFGVLLRILKRRDWAEDALQDTYVRVWQHAASYRAQKGRPWPWLVSIARYRALDMLRSRRRSPVDEADGSERIENSAVIGIAEFAPDNRALQRCLEQLRPSQRLVLIMCYCEGYSHGELSARLKAPVGTVKSWVRRGLKALRECLEP